VRGRKYRTLKKPKDLSLCDCEECGRGEGGGGYGTLMESDAVDPSDHGEGDTRPGRTHKKQKDLSCWIVYFETIECMGVMFVYYESMKGELQTIPIYECRCDERLKTKVEESTLLTYTGLLGELEHLKMETGFIDEMFASVMGEYGSSGIVVVVYYESRKRELKI
jgi:hypothetical protein